MVARQKKKRPRPGKRITTTYEIVTPESAEEGDAAERGWIDEDGEDMLPDEDDREEGLSAVDKAVKFLEENGATEPSEDGFDRRAGYPARWWTNNDYDTDYGTGAVESRSYHLAGFTDDEKRAIFRRLRPLRKN